MSRAKVTIHSTELIKQLEAKGIVFSSMVPPGDLDLDICADCVVMPLDSPSSIVIFARREDQKTIRQASASCPWLSVGDFIFPRGHGGTYRILSIE
jgi:hypothetical protein